MLKVMSSRPQTRASGTRSEFNRHIEFVATSWPESVDELRQAIIDTGYGELRRFELHCGYESYDKCEALEISGSADFGPVEHEPLGWVP